MTQPIANRIMSLDLLKGLVMIIMALDHTRDYFHADAFLFDPTDPEKTNAAIFFTRWITHFCAPAFSLLAGISAYLVGMRKSKAELSKFLLSRGIWLMFIELTVVNFGWFFDVHFSTIPLLVIWVLGVSMVCLAAIIHLPFKAILAFSLVVIFGHNLLDNLHFEDSFLWSFLHERNFFPISETRTIVLAYPLLPWVGVMSLGYYVGSFYNKIVEAKKRQQLFTYLGIACVLLFFALRGVNGYGNPKAWSSYETALQTFFSFMDPLKYPPSLSYLLMTLGPTFVFLGLAENLKGKVVDVISVFGKVPFFYYIVHLYIIHLGAMLLAELTGYGWQIMLLPQWIGRVTELQGYGLSLGGTYLVWLAIVVMLYPLCLKFSKYKLAHKEKWWLSYF